MTKKFHFLIDYDTPIVAAAAMQQKNSIVVTHNDSKRKKEFDNITTFKSWLKEHPKWTLEQFSIEDKSAVVGGVNQAVEGLLSNMYNISESPYIKSYKFVVGGKHGNFRNDVARIQPYKGQRKAKPLLFDKIKETLLRKVPQHIIQPHGAFESDDVLSMFLYENKEDRAISFIDKDLTTVVGWSNSFKTMEKPVYTDEFTAFYNLMVQSLCGDVSDNVLGIPHKVDSVIKRFELRRGKGFGKASAAKCLEGATSIEALIERVVFVYQETFKDGLILDSGEKLNWIEVMDENIQLLKMLDYEGQQYIFSKEFGIKP